MAKGDIEAWTPNTVEHRTEQQKARRRPYAGAKPALSTQHISSPMSKGGTGTARFTSHMYILNRVPKRGTKAARFTLGLHNTVEAACPKEAPNQRGLHSTLETAETGCPKEAPKERGLHSTLEAAWPREALGQRTTVLINGHQNDNTPAMGGCQKDAPRGCCRLGRVLYACLYYNMHVSF